MVWKRVCIFQQNLNCMKNKLLLLLITCCALTACKKENATEDIISDNFKPNYTIETIAPVNFQGINKVLIMGNSLTIHNSYPSLGWYQNCGMAASSQEKDYVHLLTSKIQSVNPKAIVKYGRIGDFELNFWKYDTTFFTENIRFKPDLIIIQIGENIDDDKALTLGLRNHIVGLVNRIKKNDHVTVCLTNSFWPNKNISNEIKTACQMGNYLMVNVAELYADRSNTGDGFFSNQSVANHPGDKGMKNIADRIWNTIASASYPVAYPPEKPENVPVHSSLQQSE